MLPISFINIPTSICAHSLVLNTAFGATSRTTWLATAVTLGVTILLLIKNRFVGFSLGRFGSGKEKKTEAVQKTGPSRAHAFGVGGWRLPNLMDATLLRTLALSFLIGFIALAAIFNIFTLFELWRFIAVNNSSLALVARYLLFLMPLVTVELLPATMLISILVTYALLAKRHDRLWRLRTGRNTLSRIWHHRGCGGESGAALHRAQG